MIHTILIWIMAAILVVLFLRARAISTTAAVLKSVALSCVVVLAWAGLTVALVMAGVL
ncbi:hypothetical protein [Rhodosalinus sediminis]|uniref:hypothetical protein n=1 Tax=Rhodosalinus sediminis TaxID=1940533 RepID=UPI002355CBF0|nr:hypothetical protein [Rhodosalinus sediminis]